MCKKNIFSNIVIYSPILKKKMKNEKKGLEVVPGPIAPRFCACGCENLFTPNRMDKFYINKQHYDKAYNNGPRKRRAANRKNHEKILAKNDRILNKHFLNLRFEKFKTVYFDVLEADGFDFAFNIGIEDKDNIRWFFSYKYVYRIIDSTPKKVLIQRR
jgi:hypothetical protein